MKKAKYENWEVHPQIRRLPTPKRKGTSPIWRHMKTKHEGKVPYFKLWNFWVRSGVEAELRSERFFRDYESANADTDKLLRDIGFSWKKAETEQEVWKRIGLVWNWLKDHVRVDNDAYSDISSVDGTWPSILDYARYYATHDELVWAACFSKAHLFATLLGRMVYPRYRFSIAEAHHTEGGAPPTASHVYVAVYVGERWFYLDPTAVHSKTFPAYKDRKSIGVSGFRTVDYEHPYTFIPVPLSGVNRVAFLPK
jgi:hypothetical protein